MKRKEKIVPILIALAFFALGALPAQAVPSLYDWAFNVDGTTYEALLGDAMPTTGTLTDGLGSLSWETSDAGAHTFIAFFDHEFSEGTNTWWNEYGDADGTAATGQSWEIDEPGYVFGDIYQNTTGWNGWDYSSIVGLDNLNSVDSSSPNDVSMAMGWDFTLAANQTATISLILGEIVPNAGFYLSQTDTDSGETIYFSSILDIQGGGGPGPGPAPVPEPSTLLLMGIGLMGLLGVQRKRASRKKV